MRIGFDISQTAEDKAGCGYVADQLIRSLLRIDTGNEYILYPTFYSYRNPLFYKATYPKAKNCRIYFRDMSFQEMFRRWEEKTDDRTGWLGFPDIVHSNNFSCIKDHRAKIVFLLYDVAPLVYPEFTTEDNRLVCFDGLFNASIYADHCIAISAYTKKSFLSFFPSYPEERITVAHLGIRPTIKLIQEKDHLNRLLNRFGLSVNGFWLGVGTVEPRKNYGLLIDAYSKLKDSRPLVIAGGKGWLESDLNRKIDNLALKDMVKFLGYVSDEELSALYSSCFAFVYPSYYEGFGLPVLEAMSCGAAVITSNTSSLPEVGGDAALYINPASKESLIEKMEMLLLDDSLRSELRHKSLIRAGIFSWEKTARIVLEVYQKTISAEPWLRKSYRNIGRGDLWVLISKLKG